MLKFYRGFEIDDFSGEPLTDAQMTERHYSKIMSLQRVAFRKFAALKPFALANIGSVDTREGLTEHLSKLTDAELHQIASSLDLVAPQADEAVTDLGRHFLMEILITRHERRLSQLDALNEMPLFPTEETIWDENIVPTEFYADGCLALPKLNVQFLTMHDYLLRNLNLFRLESTYDIRTDMEETIPRLKAINNGAGETQFQGWSRMAQPVTGFSVVEIGKPNLGESCPSSVRADITLHLGVRDHIKLEWEGLRKHDVGFLISIRAPPPGTEMPSTATFLEEYGVLAVRGCEIEGMLDGEGRIIDDNPMGKGEKPAPQRDDDRTYRVWLDSNQYQSDLDASTNGDAIDVYETFNVFMRRNPKENNFKAVLETIRNLMNTNCVVPEWLNDVFLGFGEPSSAHYAKLESQEAAQNFNDTFLSLEHLKESFPDFEIESTCDEAALVPPLRLEFPMKAKPKASGFAPRNVKKSKAPAAVAPVADSEPTKQIIKVTPIVAENRGPYPHNQPKLNTVKFTSAQVEAIRAGMQPGLNVVVGPPGTGKTDVAVQIISNIYHNHPEQRTLIVTHSNMALNQLFEKIMALDIEERHLLRLGRGEKDLQTDQDMSKYGRVDFVLGERLKLLAEVQKLSGTFEGIDPSLTYTCETAGHFHLYHCQSRWQEFQRKVSKTDVADIAAKFPYTDFFADAPPPLFKGESYTADLEIAAGCNRYIDSIFERLKEYRAFEILHRGRDRSKYLLVKEAKIIAMTCTHAALTRSELVKLGFKYDNVLMEESAQILEIETFIPLLLQNPEDGFSRLKRVTLIGDHHQLPPVIKNMAFKKFSNMEQSLFTRFIRLGVPSVLLDAQGRSRPSLSQLYQWHYDGLGNLSHTLTRPEFIKANPGFTHDSQVIEVGDYKGQGEHCPELHFFQNMAEAEYVVAVYMYMRLLGYPGDRIAMLTTYNGQKALLNDVVRHRCGSNPMFGFPATIETVDKYQGSQNDYILLSLVRTKHVGHLRDVRRLIVALSRARLGLYVFCRSSLYKDCHELKPAFDILLKRPTQLMLHATEMYPPTRNNADAATTTKVVVQDMEHMGKIVHAMATVAVEQLNSGAEWNPEGYGAPVDALSQQVAPPAAIVAKPKAAVAAVASGGKTLREVPAALTASKSDADMTAVEAETPIAAEEAVAVVEEPKSTGRKTKRARSPEAEAAAAAVEETDAQKEATAPAAKRSKAKPAAKKTLTRKKAPEPEPEQEPEPEAAAAAPAEEVPDFSKMTVKLLQAELTKRDLDTKGKKAVLVARLQEATA
jgi:intron-binding protein aquarius